MSRSRFRYFRKLAETFPDEPDRNLYFFRDLLVPRFGHLFVHDSINAAKDDPERQPEINSILRCFAAMVRANKYVSRRYKTKLRIVVFALTSLPRKTPLIFRMIARLPLVRRFLLIT